MTNSVQDNVFLLSWDKDVTLKNVDEFRATVRTLLESDKRKLLLKLSGVSYLNSAALGVIADAVLASGRMDKELVLADIQPTVDEIFQIVHFSTFMKIFMDIEDAYAYFQGENG
ncbi:STAS domain-containing protein [Paenibacillus sp. sgz500958]|uniref:STAS domain-containing protein n=1 Tax=Paenibacillus sp. sgz500958 TaxID=3242475 RepID=UPI0036D2CD5C